MKIKIFFIIVFLILFQLTVWGTDPYILLTTDTAQLNYVQSICDNLGLSPVKSISLNEGNGIVLGPFLHGVMAYENLQVIKTSIPSASILRISKGGKPNQLCYSFSQD